MKDIETLITQYTEAVGFSAFLIKNDMSVRDLNPGIPSYGLAMALYDSLRHPLPPLWTTRSPEGILAGGIYLQPLESIFLIAPAFRMECSLHQARQIIFRLGLPETETGSVQRALNRFTSMDEYQLRKHLSFLDLLANEETAREPVSLDFHWNAAIRRPTLHSTEVVQNEAGSLLESRILALVRHGKEHELQRYYSLFVTRQNSSFSDSIENLGQMRRYMIGANMLFSRIAVSEGVDLSLINSITDMYGQQIENMSNPQDLNQLFLDFSLRYTRLIADLNKLSTDSLLARQIARHIQAHLFDPLSLSDIAAALGYSKNHLCTEFKKATGMTVAEYIARSKVREASFLLDTYALSIEEISTELGFSSASYFIKVFKKVTGKTPGEARLAARQEPA